MPSDREHVLFSTVKRSQTVPSQADSRRFAIFRQTLFTFNALRDRSNSRSTDYAVPLVSAQGTEVIIDVFVGEVGRSSKGGGQQDDICQAVERADFTSEEKEILRDKKILFRDCYPRSDHVHS